MSMKTAQACKLIAERRGDALVVTTMTGMAEFFKVSDGSMTVSSVPLMGGAAGIGLGLALAEPDRRVIVIDGDASLLMQLGSLASVVDASPENFIHFVIGNKVNFEGLANLPIPAVDHLKFDALAEAAGYRRCYSFDDADRLAEEIDDILTEAGPVFVELNISPNPPAIVDGSNRAFQFPPNQFTRMRDEAHALMAALSSTDSN